MMKDLDTEFNQVLDRIIHGLDTCFKSELIDELGDMILSHQISTNSYLKAVNGMQLIASKSSNVEIVESALNLLLIASEKELFTKACFSELAKSLEYLPNELKEYAFEVLAFSGDVNYLKCIVKYIDSPNADLANSAKNAVNRLRA